MTLIEQYRGHTVKCHMVQGKPLIQVEILEGPGPEAELLFESEISCTSSTEAMKWAKGVIDEVCDEQEEEYD